MIDIKDKNLENKLKNKNTALISGGSLQNGSVPFYNEYEKILKIKEKNILLNAHTGYIPPEHFEKTLIFDTISLDISGSDKIIKQIYNLNLDLGKLQENILAYNDFLLKISGRKPKIVPHITIGIYYGENSSEEEAIDFISKISTDKLVFNILIPTKNTEFENIKKIEIKRVLELIKYSKEKLKNRLIYIGCMRPFGKYREDLDFALLENDVDAIVNPSTKFLKFAEDNLKDCIKLNGCCSIF